MFRTPRKIQKGHDFWISYSDLMAGLLLVFILVTIIVLFRSKQSYEVQSEQLDTAQKEIEESKVKLLKIDLNVEKILGIRTAIIVRLKKKFDESGKDIHFDDETGAIRLGSNILFKEGSSRLTKEGKDALKNLIPIYYDALLGDPNLRSYVGQIVFEGHTNSNFRRGFNEEQGYLYNLQLSQQRAYEAMAFIIQQKVGDKFHAKELLAANGYSSSRPILNSSSVEDKALSRRLEIRFRLNDEQSLNKLNQLFERISNR